MLVLAVVGAMLLAPAGVVLSQASLQQYAEEDAGAIPESYIVVLKDDIGQDPEQVANEMALQYGLEVTQIYQYALQGFAARIPAETLPAVRADERVSFVSEDQEVQAFDSGGAESVETPS